MKLLFAEYTTQIKESYENLLPQWFIAKVIIFQNKINQKLNFLLPEPHLSIIKSLLFGGKNNLSYQLKNLIRNSGLAHLFAVSGLHLTLIIQFLLYIFNNLPFSRLIKFTSIIVIVITYVVMADFSSSVIRAAVMVFIMILAFINYRQYRSSWALLLTVLIITLINPIIIIRDVGFQLSILATLGIIYFNPLLNRTSFDNNLETQKLLWKLISVIKDSFKLCLSALITVMPWSIYQFHQFSLITPMTNILIVPLVPLIMILSFIVIFLSFTFQPLAFISSWILKLLIDYVLIIINFFGNLKIANIFIPRLPLILILILIYYGMLIIIINHQRQQIIFINHE